MREILLVYPCTVYKDKSSVQHFFFKEYLLQQQNNIRATYMTRGKNYLYNIQGKEVPYYSQKLLEHKPSYTLRMYPISKSRIINKFSELCFYKTREQNQSQVWSRNASGYRVTCKMMCLDINTQVQVPSGSWDKYTNMSIEFQ